MLPANILAFKFCAVNYIEISLAKKIISAIYTNTHLNMVCTATIVLQSARVSSSAELLSSLFTTTTFSAKVIPARRRSSRQSMEPSIQ